MENKSVKIGYLIKPAVFVLFALILEMVNFLWLGFKVTGHTNWAQVFPTYIILDLCVFFLIAGIIFLLKRVWANVVYYFFLGFQLLLNMVNATLYKVFGDLFSWDMLNLGGEAAASFKFEFIDFWSIAVNLLILGVIIFVQIVLDRKIKKEVFLKRLSKFALSLAVFLSILTVSSLSFTAQLLTFKDTDSNLRVAESDQYLWDNMQFKIESYKKFGTYGFYIKNLSNIIYKDDGYDQVVEIQLKKLLALEEQGNNVNAELYGDNLIVIMMESYEWYAIDPYNTPTLWDIKENSGVALTNYHSKNKTNISEELTLFGNTPKDNTINKLAEKNYLNTKYSLPNMFDSLGYETSYFHTYKKTFYDRDVINSSIGFDNVYGIEDADIENKSIEFNDWNLDSDFAKSMIEKIAPTDKKFFSFFTTVTTHGTYDQENKRFGQYYKEFDENLDADGELGAYATQFYSSKVTAPDSMGYKNWMKQNTDYVYPKDERLASAFRQYKCAAMDTDRMVKFVIDYLEETGLSENTTILMYSDHNSFYQDLVYNIKGIEKTDFYNTYLYNVPCMIYSKKLTAEKNTTFVNTYDLYPTLCELYGLNYTTALTHGYNVFSEEIENSVMVSYLSGIFNDYYFSRNISDVYVQQEGATQEDLDRFKLNACKYYEKQELIELIYKYGLALN